MNTPKSLRTAVGGFLRAPLYPVGAHRRRHRRRARRYRRACISQGLAAARHPALRKLGADGLLALALTGAAPLAREPAN